MENRSYIRSIVWGVICLAAVAFAYSLGWEQGVETGQQRGFMQAEVSRSVWNSEEMTPVDDELPPKPTKKPQRHNASAKREEAR